MFFSFVFAEVIFNDILHNSNLIDMLTVEQQLQRGHSGSAEGSDGEERNLAAVLQMSYSPLRDDHLEVCVVSFFLSHILHFRTERSSLDTRGLGTVPLSFPPRHYYNCTIINFLH